MAYQIFAKGKEITGVESSMITSTSQWSGAAGQLSTLSALSISGFTLTNSSGVSTNMIAELSLTDLIVGQTYTLNFTGTTTPSGGYQIATFFLYGLSDPFNDTLYVGNFTAPSGNWVLEQSFTAIESSAKITFRSYNGADGDVFVGSGISVTTAGTGFNGVYELDVLKGSPFT
jgi:hypothetical protein